VIIKHSGVDAGTRAVSSHRRTCGSSGGGRPAQAGAPDAAAQARAWQLNAAAWAGRLARAFPLYADLWQPLALAAHELGAGLDLLANAAGACARAGSGAYSGADAVVAQLMAFPPPPVSAAPGAQPALSGIVMGRATGSQSGAQPACAISIRASLVRLCSASGRPAQNVAM